MHGDMPFLATGNVQAKWPLVPKLPMLETKAGLRGPAPDGLKNCASLPALVGVQMI